MMSGTSLTRPLTRDSAVEADAAISPDLTRIAWVAAPGARLTSFQLVVADADGEHARVLTADSVPVGRPVASTGADRNEAIRSSNAWSAKRSAGTR
jgi:hypothetical protein